MTYERGVPFAGVPRRVTYCHRARESRFTCETVLIGEIHGAHNLKNGTLFRTSPVKWIRGDIGIARTQDAVYVLRNRR